MFVAMKRVVKLDKTSKQFLADLHIQNDTAGDLLTQAGYVTLARLFEAPPNFQLLKDYGFNTFQCNRILKEIQLQGTQGTD